MQLILTTDGAATFAVFVHEGFAFLLEEYEVGFDAGNQRNHSVRNYDSPSSIPRLAEGYRIDGECT